MPDEEKQPEPKKPKQPAPPEPATPAEPATITYTTRNPETGVLEPG